MKLVSYQSDDGQSHLGSLHRDRIVNLHQASRAELPDDMLQFLQLGDSAMEMARALVAGFSTDSSADASRLYRGRLGKTAGPDHQSGESRRYRPELHGSRCIEAGFEVPEFATMFCKYSSSIVGSGDDIRWSQGLTQQVDYEAELALVIGKTARKVAAVQMLMITSPVT